MNTNIIKHEGEIEIVGVKLPCYVLEDGTRVLSASETQEVLRRVGTNSISKEKETDSLKPILCHKENIVINCYESTVLIDIWGTQETNSTKGQSPKQKLVEEQQEVLFFSFAKVGITSLIDEATGYQQERRREEMRALTKAYIISRRATGLISESDKNDFFKYLVLRYYSKKELGDWEKIKKTEFGRMLKFLVNSPMIREKEIKKKVNEIKNER